MSKFKKFRVLGSTVLLLVVLLGGAFYAANYSAGDALAGASISGNPVGATSRALITVNGSSKVSQIAYFGTGAKTNPGANTPVASGKVCGANGSGIFHYAELRLAGTMTGTAPTLTVKLQDSYDGGVTWVDAKTFTQINATTVPAVSTQVAADTGGSSFFNGTSVATIPAAVYGDCWRITYTYGGTSAGASFSVIGVDK